MFTVYFTVIDMFPVICLLCYVQNVDGSEHAITDIGIKLPPEALDAPPPPSLEDLKQQKLIELATAAQAAVTDGFQSDTLGSPHTYLCRPTDQQTLQAVVNDATQVELPDDWAYPLWCHHSEQGWDFISHTATQVLTIAEGASAHRCACAMKNATLAQKVAEAKTVEEIQTIMWN